MRVLGGYNAFLDRGRTAECLERRSTSAPAVGGGNVEGRFYLRHVKSREDLAKELDVDVSASVKAPQASGDAALKVVKTFKTSATTVTFLVRAVRSYVVTNQSEVALTPAALGWLRNAPDEFLAKCGGSYAQSVTYEAQVLAMLQFEAKTEESAQQIRTALGAGTGGGLIQNLTSAAGQLETKAEETAALSNASLSITVTTSGFLTSEQHSTGDTVEHSFEKMDELRAEMNRSFERDLEADRRDYFGNGARNARPIVVGQSSYRQAANSPNDAAYTRITTTLSRAEEFVKGITPVYLRMERAYTDEVQRFLDDTTDQFRYNLAVGPKLRTSELLPIAEKWAAAFGTGGATDASLVHPLQMSIERCMSAASNGDYSACTLDPAIRGDIRRAEEGLGEYARTGRILPVVAWMPRLDAAVSYRNAESECGHGSMRLPKREEMKVIAPAVTALASPGGEVWFAADAQCAKPYFANGSGEGTFGCADTASEPLPYVGDRPVLCVGRSGPIPASPAP